MEHQSVIEFGNAGKGFAASWAYSRAGNNTTSATNHRLYFSLCGHIYIPLAVAANLCAFLNFCRCRYTIGHFYVSIQDHLLKLSFGDDLEVGSK